MRRFSYNWLKLRAWELTDYDAVLLLDSDMTVVRLLIAFVGHQCMNCGITFSHQWMLANLLRRLSGQCVSSVFTRDRAGLHESAAASGSRAGQLRALSLTLCAGASVQETDLQHIFQLPTEYATVLDVDKLRSFSRFSPLGAAQGGVHFFRPCAAVRCIACQPACACVSRLGPQHCCCEPARGLHMERLPPAGEAAS